MDENLLREAAKLALAGPRTMTEKEKGIALYLIMEIFKRMGLHPLDGQEVLEDTLKHIKKYIADAQPIDFS